ncbi:MAG TPA: response regulator [Ktedonobacteraceae bacterium]|nr:response regulator [Ktedonobacteraceae bacterium]
MACIGLLEDNSRIAKLCVTMLNLAGHEVILFEDAKECLNALFAVPTGYKSNGTQFFNEPVKTSRSNFDIEVLILDLHLPDMNGFELLHYLQTHPNTRSLPLIFCTAATENEVNQALSIAPRAWVVWKPFKLQALTSAINEALQAS